MYSLELTLTNLLKKSIRVERLEDTLIFINDFERVNPSSVISVKTTNGIFSIRKDTVISIEMKECN